MKCTGGIGAEHRIGFIQDLFRHRWYKCVNGGGSSSTTRCPLRPKQCLTWDGLKSRIITYAKDRQAIDLSTFAGNQISTRDVGRTPCSNRLFYWMVHCRYRT